MYERMKMLSDVFFQVPSLNMALSDKSIKADEKKKILFTATGGEVLSSLCKMSDLIFKNEREHVVQYIALRYLELYRRRYSIQYGKLVTAVPVSGDKQKTIISRLKKIAGQNLEIELVVDPDIIGGFVLHLTDYRWDGSVSGELTRIKSSFRNLETNKLMI